MLSLFNRYATPLITGLFVISLVTGIALFFHFGPSGFREMHEILSLVLIVPFVLHIWKNWRPFVSYFKHAPMAIGLALSLAMAVPFLLPTSSESAGGDRAAMFGLVRQVMAASPAEIAPLLHSSEAEVSAALSEAGIALAAGQSLGDAATAAGVSETELASLLVSIRKD
ncbi:DUF4405 domain-containing protein [Thioclava sp. FR2]|uniref:DUF4405 domain-containing protein n=1 Tax=Thioclava sp. FR2 TaxID=3445780 RepID=UPI003EB6DB5E